MLSYVLCNFILELSFPSEIAGFAEEFVIHLVSIFYQVFQDILIFNFCFILHFKSISIKSISY